MRGWAIRVYEWCQHCEQRAVVGDGHLLCALCRAEFYLTLEDLYG